MLRIKGNQLLAVDNHQSLSDLSINCIDTGGTSSFGYEYTGYIESASFSPFSDVKLKLTGKFNIYTGSVIFYNEDKDINIILSGTATASVYTTADNAGEEHDGKKWYIGIRAQKTSNNKLKIMCNIDCKVHVSGAAIPILEFTSLQLIGADDCIEVKDWCSTDQLYIARTNDATKHGLQFDADSNLITWNSVQRSLPALAALVQISNTDKIIKIPVSYIEKNNIDYFVFSFRVSDGHTYTADLTLHNFNISSNTFTTIENNSYFTVNTASIDNNGTLTMTFEPRGYTISSLTNGYLYIKHICRTTSDSYYDKSLTVEKNTAIHGNALIGGDVSIGGSLTIPSTSRLIINDIEPLRILDSSTNTVQETVDVMNNIFSSRTEGYNRYNFYLFRIYFSENDYKDYFMHNLEQTTFDDSDTFQVWQDRIVFGHKFYNYNIMVGRNIAAWGTLGWTSSGSNVTQTYTPISSSITKVKIYLLPMRIGW